MRFAYLFVGRRRFRYTENARYKISVHMNKQVLIFLVALFGGYFFISVQPVRAVIPPDFIFNIGTQIAQFFSIVVLSLATLLGVFLRFFEIRFSAMRHRKFFLISTFSLIVGVSLGMSYFYTLYEQKLEYKKWLEESKKFDALHDVVPGSDMYTIEIKNSSDLMRNDGTGGSTEGLDKNDRLNFETDVINDIDVSSSRFISGVSVVDDSTRFIKEYYESIANGDFERAYKMSKQEVDYAVFRGWYLRTTKITLDKFVQIDKAKSSIELTLYEDESFTRYGVLMTLVFQGSIPIQVGKSEVKILSQGLITRDKAVSVDRDAVSREYEFFASHEKKNTLITNQEFKNSIESGKYDFIVLDARENIEYENGYFPGSLHIRFADLKAGRWIELPKDKFVYVLCWSGIRGKEVSDFLRMKKIVASYLENGANGWFEFGGEWIGNIKFGEKYTDLKYQVVFNTNEVKDKVREGVVLVDTREPYKFQRGHITGSVSIPIMYTPTIDLESAFSQVPARSRFITVCDGYVNCFDAKITGVELERRGNQFLGRYNRPWEYEK